MSSRRRRLVGTLVVALLGAATHQTDAWAPSTPFTKPSLGMPVTAAQPKGPLRELTSSGGQLNVDLTVAPWVQVRPGLGPFLSFYPLPPRPMHCSSTHPLKSLPHPPTPSTIHPYTPT